MVQAQTNIHTIAKHQQHPPPTTRSHNANTKAKAAAEKGNRMLVKGKGMFMDVEWRAFTFVSLAGRKRSNTRMRR
jgi:hypothetical protein